MQFDAREFLCKLPEIARLISLLEVIFTSCDVPESSLASLSASSKKFYKGVFRNTLSDFQSDIMVGVRFPLSSAISTKGRRPIAQARTHSSTVASGAPLGLKDLVQWPARGY